MSDEIRPALTPEEWAIERDYSGTPLHERLRWAADEAGVGSRHALAALALYGQPFGFTREDVEALREAYVPLGRYVDYDFDALADRIAALLPPNEAE